MNDLEERLSYVLNVTRSNINKSEWTGKQKYVYVCLQTYFLLNAEVYLGQYKISLKFFFVKTIFAKNKLQRCFTGSQNKD